MIKKDEKGLFVFGAPKTSTSTIVAMLNCHPEILMLFEAYSSFGPVEDLSKFALNRRDIFLKQYPALNPIFEKEFNTELYPQLFMEIDLDKYRYAGDKLQGFHFDSLKQLSNHKAIFLIRDIRTWLSKNKILAHFKNADNLSDTGLLYLEYLLFAKLHIPDALFLTMEELVLKNSVVITKLEEYLGISMKPLKKWWTKSGRYDPKSPKYYWPWVDLHKSSSVKPGKLDTTANLKSNPYWDDILPLFDKYYNNPDRKFSSDEILIDIETIRKLRGKHNASLNDCYTDVESKSLTSTKQKIKTKLKIMLKK